VLQQHGPSDWQMHEFSCPVQAYRGLAVIVVCHRCSAALQVETTRVPSSQRVCRRLCQETRLQRRRHSPPGDSPCSAQYCRHEAAEILPDGSKRLFIMRCP
jgi:hypothetical protein